MDLWRPWWLDARDVYIMRVSLPSRAVTLSHWFRVPFPRARTNYKSSDIDNQEAPFDLTAPLL
jgi:hypothetical protein